MANIFAILTAIVLAVSAFLAYQNKGRADEAGRGYEGWMKKTKDEQGALARKRDQLAGTQAELNERGDELEDYNGRNAKLDAELTAQKATNTKLDEEVAAKEQEASNKSDEVESKKKALTDIGDPEDLLGELQQIRADIARLDLEIEQGISQQGTLESQRNSVDQALGDVRERIGWRTRGKSNPGLNTTVRNVYRNLGFVTLSGGDNLGIVKDSTLDVVRDGEVVAKLQVTTVEAGTAAADIVPESLAAGESVRAGDRVRTPSEPEPAAAPAAPAAPAAVPEPVNPEPTDAVPEPETAPELEPEPEPAPEEPMEEADPFAN